MPLTNISVSKRHKKELPDSANVQTYFDFWKSEAKHEWRNTLTEQFWVALSAFEVATRKLIAKRYPLTWLKLKWEDQVVVVTRHMNCLVVQHVTRVAWIRMFYSEGLHILTWRFWTHAEAQHKPGRQGKFLLSWKQCLSGWHCPRCDRCFLYNDRWNEKLQILILEQSAIICKPISAASHPFSHPLVTAAPILCRQNLPHSRIPQCKLGEVVYSVQAASSWGSGVPESFAIAVGD